MAAIRKEEFLSHYTKALNGGYAALFIGAGMSVGAGFVDWKELLREIAADLSLDVDKETDLIALAQYHHNDRASRSKLNRTLIEEFTKDARLADNHRLLASLPVHTIWTTNYDTLIEEAFRETGKKLDSKLSAESLPLHRPHTDATLYKMHGDISAPDKAVVTKEDYELYDEAREAFSIRLKSDLISHTFLFLGFSFNDPNIDYLLSRVRALLGKNTGEHYCVIRNIPKPKGKSGKEKAEYDYNVRKQDLRIGDLKRYGIQAILIDDYSEITSLLRELNQSVHLKDVFVSGSAHDYSPLGQPRVIGLARRLGGEIVKNGMNLVSGYGLGIGETVAVGAIEAVQQDGKTTIDERVVLRPFPQGSAPAGMTREQFWKSYRMTMISRAGFAIFLCGNKLGDEGKVVPANGVLQEFEIAKAQGLFPIPIGATGHVALDIWKEVTGNLATYYAGRDLTKEFQIIGDGSKSDDDFVTAVLSIMKKAAKPCV